mmetsp:Transcript_96575/g.275599  ORF Transcript_96575/g.275599 Transcript_96575/m.275599 type:complete len:215 (+) Transcript_96575:361-1005(+)
MAVAMAVVAVCSRMCVQNKHHHGRPFDWKTSGLVKEGGSTDRTLCACTQAKPSAAWALPAAQEEPACSIGRCLRVLVRHADFRAPHKVPFKINIFCLEVLDGPVKLSALVFFFLQLAPDLFQLGFHRELELEKGCLFVAEVGILLRQFRVLCAKLDELLPLLCPFGYLGSPLLRLRFSPLFEGMFLCRFTICQRGDSPDRCAGHSFCRARFDTV